MELMDTYNPIVEQLRSTNGKLRQRVAELEEDRSALMKSIHDQADRYDELTTERDALKQQRDYLVTALEWALGNINCEPYEWTCEEDSDAHRSAIEAIASVKEKQNGA